MNWIKGSALQENTLKSRRRGGGKDGHLSLIQIGNLFEGAGNSQPCVRAQKHLGTSVRYYDPERNFFPRLFRNHTIAQSQQLARLCVSEPTIWISQKLPWQEWQCLHSGSSARAANLIPTFSSSSSFRHCHSQPAGLHHVTRSSRVSLVDSLNRVFLGWMQPPHPN